ncbi:hypothetical protein QUF72_00320 [Desulfobacterales bacterium HSG2]|nr:hypothetical protein [Desulfobacterales bacterium HSG2]
MRKPEKSEIKIQNIFQEGHMPAKWPADIVFREVILTVGDRTCQFCGGRLKIRKSRIHRIHSLEGPLRLVCKLSCCSDRECPGNRTLLSPRTEIPITMPRWRIGWDVLLRMGFRRNKRHWSVPRIQAELRDSCQLRLSEDAIAEYLRKYQTMVAARHQDVARLREICHDCQDVILTIDGIQPEKGHETPYVVRELRKQRIWFAESLLSGTYAEIRKVIRRAKILALHPDMPVRAWVSDKQEAFVVNIAAEFPDVPHRHCDNHFLRDPAQPVLERDIHAKVRMRRKIRGLRTIEKEILAETDGPSQATAPPSQNRQMYAARIVPDYCAAVRGILNDNHGGPLTPPGWRMATALTAVSQSIGRNLSHPSTPISGKLGRLSGFVRRGLSVCNREKGRTEEYVDDLRRIFGTLSPDNGTPATRQTEFRHLTVQPGRTKDPVRIHMSDIMRSFEEGLFVGSDDPDIPRDNPDLERWFRKPKGHERRIHEHQHAGIRIVCQGPTLLPAPDAHLSRTVPFTYQELLPYVGAKVPESQNRSLERHRIMKKASSKKNGPIC